MYMYICICVYIYTHIYIDMYKERLEQRFLQVGGPCERRVPRDRGSMHTYSGRICCLGEDVPSN